MKKFALYCGLLAPGAAYALDSYRYLHVTIDTLWYIFLFLVPGVLAPIGLAAWLYWRNAKRASSAESDHDK